MFKSNSKGNKKEKGQGLVEYALILVLVAIVVIAVLMLLGPIIGNVFSTINGSLLSFGGGGGGAAAAAAPAEPAEEPVNINIWDEWDAGHTGTNTYFSCEMGHTYTISYVASAHGGVTGTSPGHPCFAWGGFAGNFVLDQEVTVTDDVTGDSAHHTVN